MGSLGGGFNDGDTVDGVGPQGGVDRLGLGGFRVDAKIGDTNYDIALLFHNIAINDDNILYRKRKNTHSIVID